MRIAPYRRNGHQAKSNWIFLTVLVVFPTCAGTVMQESILYRPPHVRLVLFGGTLRIRFVLELMGFSRSAFHRKMREGERNVDDDHVATYSGKACCAGNGPIAMFASRTDVNSRFSHILCAD